MLNLKKITDLITSFYFRPELVNGLDGIKVLNYDFDHLGNLRYVTMPTDGVWKTVSIKDFINHYKNNK